MFLLGTSFLLTATGLLVSTGVYAEKVTTCGTHVHRLSCDTGVISVKTSVYGRTDAQTCAVNKPAEELANTACSLQGAADTLKKRCDGKKVCEVAPSIFPSDPCSNTFKYMETVYSCIPANYIVACEQSLAHLDCDGGKVISVHGADYGRHDQTTCSYRRDPAVLQNVDCSNPTEIVAERCNGRKMCAVRACASVFGKACGETDRYLQVAYTCQDPVPS